MAPSPISPLSPADQERVTVAVVSALKNAGLPPSDDPLSLRSRFLQWLLVIVIGCLVGYFSAHQAIGKDIDDVRATENGHYQELKSTQESNFGEVIRRMDVLQADIREIRQGGK
jgi:hypothetical protein